MRGKSRNGRWDVARAAVFFVFWVVSPTLPRVRPLRWLSLLDTSGRESMIWIGMFATVLLGYGWLKVRRRNRKTSQGSN